MELMPKQLQKKQKKFYKDKITVLSPAKINLYLNVLGKYSLAPKYHELESIFERISLFDRITLKLTKEKKLSLTSNIKEIISPNNLCLKAVSLVQKEFKIKCGCDIYLEKNIPIGSGLGGASSNAASVILALNKIFHLNLSLDKLYKLGEKLGSDVNFFLSKESFALVKGRGEKVFPFEAIPLFHTIIWPKVVLSTKRVYKNLKVNLTKFINNVNILMYALKRKDMLLLERNIFNALEKSALQLSKKILTIKLYLQKNKINSWITGSGSALFTLDKLPPKIKKSLEKRCLIFEVGTF